MLLAFFAATAISLSGHSLWERALQRISRFTDWLGKISFSVYLVHWPVLQYFGARYPDTDVLYAHVGAVTAAVVYTAVGHCFVTTGLLRVWRKSVPGLKEAFYLPGDSGARGKFRKS